FARSFGLPRVGVPQSIHESARHVKLIFEKFSKFLSTIFQNIEKSMKSKFTFFDILALPEKNA
ncbi:MAG: hypothetical protein Q4F38_01255, partial [Akkermansia sp.]|nr:hypothetical protein [Akkermansia sp.]